MARDTGKSPFNPRIKGLKMPAIGMWVDWGESEERISSHSREVTYRLDVLIERQLQEDPVLRFPCRQAGESLPLWATLSPTLPLHAVFWKRPLLWSETGSAHPLQVQGKLGVISSEGPSDPERSPLCLQTEYPYSLPLVTTYKYLKHCTYCSVLYYLFFDSKLWATMTYTHSFISISHTFWPKV